MTKNGKYPVIKLALALNAAWAIGQAVLTPSQAHAQSCTPNPTTHKTLDWSSFKFINDADGGYYQAPLPTGNNYGFKTASSATGFFDYLPWNSSTLASVSLCRQPFAGGSATCSSPANRTGVTGWQDMGINTNAIGGASNNPWDYYFARVKFTGQISQVLGLGINTPCCA
jgi:hypothetical protein